jgi:hypothetical protein
MKTREFFNFFNFSSSETTFFEHILKKSTHSFFGAWSFLLVHIWFTPSEEPKDIIIGLPHILVVGNSE